MSVFLKIKFVGSYPPPICKAPSFGHCPPQGDDALLLPPHMNDLCLHLFLRPFICSSVCPFVCCPSVLPIPRPRQLDGRVDGQIHKPSICGGGNRALFPWGADAPSPPHYLHPFTEMGHRMPMTTSAESSICGETIPGP